MQVVCGGGLDCWNSSDGACVQRSGQLIRETEGRRAELNRRQKRKVPKLRCIEAWAMESLGAVECGECVL